MVTPWGDRPVLLPPSWPSDVGDDNTPFEFSLALGTSPELRFMVEPLGETPSLRSNAETARALLASLASDFDVDGTRADRVWDLFMPPAAVGAFAAWVAAELPVSGAPKFKLYLNAFARGRELGPSMIEEAMVRLGFTSAWPSVARVLARRGPDLDELMYLSLDLSRSPASRLKVYVRHRRCTVADLEAAASGCPTHRPGDVTGFLQTVAPGAEVFEGRAPFSCHAFVGGSDHPTTVTTHFPINGYAAHDGIVQERVLACLRQMGLHEDVYCRALAACANRPLDQGIGLQSYASFRREHGTPRLTVYLPVEAYKPGKIAKRPSTLRPSGAVEIPKRFVQAAITNHPCLCRLRREPADWDRLQIVLANYDLCKDFPRRLGDLLSRFEDQDLRLLVMARLRDEDLSAIAAENEEPDGPRGIEEQQFAPGRRLVARLSEFCSSADPYEAVGLLMAHDIVHQQIVEFAREESRRSSSPGTSSADGGARGEIADVTKTLTVTLAQKLPDENLAATWAGARELWWSVWTFLDDLYILCYGGRDVADGFAGGACRD
jgi:hypothetical protein